MCVCVFWDRMTLGAFWQIDSLTASWTSCRAKWPLDTQTGLDSIPPSLCPSLPLLRSFLCLSPFCPIPHTCFISAAPSNLQRSLEDLATLWTQMQANYLLSLLIYTAPLLVVIQRKVEHSKGDIIEDMKRRYKVGGRRMREGEWKM